MKELTLTVGGLYKIHRNLDSPKGDSGINKCRGVSRGHSIIQAIG
jgi:hypothetical protein